MYSQQPLAPATVPSPRRGRRAALLGAIGGAVVVVAATATLFATGILGDVGESGTMQPGDRALAEPDEPSINPDDSHYSAAENVCSRLDVSAYAEIGPETGEMSTEARDDPYGQGNYEVECEQRYMVEKDDGTAEKYAML